MRNMFLRRRSNKLTKNDYVSQNWIKSSLSYANGSCVEVGDLKGGLVGIRNSRDVTGPVLRFTSDEWKAFMHGIRKGDFDSIRPF
jgi:hypothetical protein